MEETVMTGGASTLSLILSGFAAIGGIAGVVALIKTLASLKNDKKAGEIKNEASAAEAFKASVDGFEDVIEDLKKERNEAKDEARNYREERDAYRQACVTAESGYCLNYGCPLRDPARGLGPLWIREHANSPDIAGNYKTLNELIKDKGL